MWLLIFVIGLAVGFLAHRYGFCIFGAILELIELGSMRRILAVLAAMLVFSLIHLSGYRSAVEHPGMLFLLGGLLQGIGYYLASGCPLGMLVRLGEGSKFHLVVFIGFLLGMGIYTGVLQKPATAILAPISTNSVMTVTDLFR